MPRLVDESEIEALAHLPGFDSSMIRRLRRERRRVFRMYLTELLAEFKTVEQEAVYRAANDPGVDPEFLESVLKIKFRFMTAVGFVRLSLLLPGWVNVGLHRMTLTLVGSVQPIKGV